MRAEDLVGPVVVHDDGRIRYANAEFAALVGFEDSAALIGDSLWEFVPTRYREPLSEQFARVGDQSSSVGLKLDLQGTGGTRPAVAVSSQVDWEGAPLIHTSFIALQESEDSLGLSFREGAMQQAPIGITIADATAEDLPLVYVNDEFLELTGYERAEVLDRNCRFLQGEKTREEPVAEMHRAIEASESVTVELRNYRKDGSMFWNRVTISPIRDEAGTVTHYLGFQEDISDSKVYEREKALFEQHAEISEQVMYVTDSTGRIEYANPDVEAVTEYEPSEAIGASPALFRARPESQQPFASEPLTAGETQQRELTNQTKGGELYRVHQTVVPIVDDRGETTHYTVIERNVTEKRLTAQVLNVLDRVLRHNVRTAVNVIDGYAEFLESDLGTPKQSAAVKSIRERSADLREISEKVTVVRRLLEDHDEPSPLKLSHLDAVIERIRKDNPAATLSLQIEGDRDRSIAKGNVFQSALEMAVENAVERSETGSPTVEITVSRCRGDNTVAVEIADDGAVIPAEEWQIVESGTETPLEHTSGIGLWVMYWAVVALGGAVERDGDAQQRNRLTLYIPLAAETDDTETNAG